MTDWDAERYHRISDPQLAWGRAVAARLVPAQGERILDVGCGTGRLTIELGTAPGTRIVGLDPSAAMLSQATAHKTSNSRVPPMYVQGDAVALPFAAAFHAVFSNATFHWVKDHDRLFRSVHTALAPGGRLIAQCGGGGNLRRLYSRARTLMAEPRYAEYFEGWKDPWLFEGTGATRRRLEAAGFTDIDVSLVPAPTSFDGAGKYSEFIEAVCVRHEVARLPGGKRQHFVTELTTMAAADDPPFTLDYWRLNISARKHPL
jgi:trans-aconitate 2-methyltransferase